jgi:hypothetical protein
LEHGLVKPNTPIDLLKADAKDRERYRKFSLVHLTAYSVYWLTEWEIPTTYENVSVLNWRLFPNDFGMQGFPSIPDGLRTNRSLLQMRPKYRGFATSDPRQGVHLTEKGLEEATQVTEEIGPPSFSGKVVEQQVSEEDPRRPTKDRERSRNPAQIMHDIRSKILFRRYAENRLEDSEVAHLLGLVGLYDHTLPTELRKAFAQIRNDAVEAGDKQICEFLDAVGVRFSEYLNRPDPRRRPSKSKREA